jgi:molecular chaperone GrpE
MSASESNNNGDGDKPKQPDLSHEIDRAMAEAEAAVSSMEAARDAAEDEGDLVDLDEGEDEPEGPDLVGQVAELQAQLAATKDKWIRAVADLENQKKRLRRDIDDARMRTLQSVLPPFLSVLDNLERALEVADPQDDRASDATAKLGQLIEGIRMVRKEFVSALSRNGIEPVAAVGVAFDPAVHDALQQLDSPDHAPGVVIREFEKGWRMGERLLRPARVIVAGAGSTGAPPEPSDDAAQN